MHPSSQQAMQKFIETYLDKTKPLSIIEIGSRDPNNGKQLNATYRQMFVNGGWAFHGLDLAPGNGVDIVSLDEYAYPIASDEYDVVISGQVLEHVKDMFLWIAELGRILKPGGHMCVIAPWQWGYHPHPVDCWRIMRDGMRFLLNEKARLEVLEVYEYSDDCIGIARKPASQGDWKLDETKQEVAEGETLSIDVAEGMGQTDKF
jgi:SAM-dependent methyltransferase